LTPFSVVIDLYLSALGLPPARGRAARAQVVQRLLHVLDRAGTPPERAKAATHDIERAMELRDGVALDPGEAADLRGRLAGGVADLRAVMRSQGRPGLIVLEDVHQADGASLEVLRLVTERPEPGAELLIMTARPEGPPLPDADLEIELDDLVGGELRELIVDRLGDSVSPLHVAAVIARAGGNPLFVEELAQGVREAGDALPATAREVIAARVDRLSPPAKAALKVAAVLGGAVRARLLEELVGAHDLSAELDELCAEGFLVRADTAAPDADEGELAFARGLIREVVYESMSQRAQRDAHGRIGRLLASRYFAGRDEPPAVIAEHLERGGDRAGASAFWLRAGRLALSAFDAAAAAAHFTRVVDLEQRLGDPPPTVPSRTRRREAHAGREEAHRALGDLATNADDLDRLVRLSDNDPSRIADVELRTAQRQLRRGDVSAALASTGRALIRADASGPAGLRLRGEGLRLRAEAFERQARFDDALVAVRASRVMFAQLGAIVDETRAMISQGRIHLARAQYEAARDVFRPVLTRIQRLGDPLLDRTVAIHIALIQLGLGDFADAMTSATRAIELCRRHGDRAREGDAITAHAIVLAAIGRFDDAAAAYETALDLLERTASQDAYADCLVFAGLCDLRRGHGSGIAMIDEGARLAAAIGARPVVVHARVARAAALFARGDVRAAADQAAEAAQAAHEATLTGHEIVALARQAKALAEAGTGRLAADPARRCLALLETHRYPAGAIEEVLVSCAAAFAHAGDHERAETLRERARQGVLRKLRELPDPIWRAAFEMIEENRFLLR
jgi:tetratricopeptide (TPR) repeat protein